MSLKLESVAAEVATSPFWKVGVVVAGTAITAALGGWDKVTKAMVFFVVADYLAALLKALYHRKFDSSTGLKGIVKKAGYFLAVAGAHAFDTYIASSDMPLTRTAAAIACTLNDAGSFFAHLASVGVPLPTFLTNMLQTEIKRKRGAA